MKEHGQNINKELNSVNLRQTNYLDYKVFINTTYSNEKVLYIVKIGPIKDNETALYLQRKLKNDEILSKLVVE